MITWAITMLEKPFTKVEPAREDEQRDPEDHVGKDERKRYQLLDDHLAPELEAHERVSSRDSDDHRQHGYRHCNLQGGKDGIDELDRADSRTAACNERDDHRYQRKPHPGSGNSSESPVVKEMITTMTIGALAISNTSAEITPRMAISSIDDRERVVTFALQACRPSNRR